MGRTPAGQTRNRVYAFVRERLLAGAPPSVREIRDALDLRAVQTVQAHLRTLVDEGRLSHVEGQARGYRLADELGPGALQLIPLLGQVQAGALTTALEEPLGWVPVHARYGEQGGGQVFALRVRGLSMRDAGILAGDVVIVRRQADAESGDVVVALVGDEATVKTLQRCRTSGRIELHPANPDYDVMVPDQQELALLGKVVEVRRYLEASVRVDGEVW